MTIVKTARAGFRRALREGDLGAGHALGVEDLWGWLCMGSPAWGGAFLACVGLGLICLRGHERWIAAPLLGVALLLARDFRAQLA